MRRITLVALVLAALVAASTAQASRFVRYGIQDDAWLEYGPGTLTSRLEQLDRLGPSVVRVTIDWNQVEPRKGVDDWRLYDDVLNGLRKHGIDPLVTLYGTPRWANGGKPPAWAPRSKWTFAGFARRAATRYPFVRMWAIWNEPNQ